MRKKEKLIKAIALFLALMVVLTILSRAADNLTIAFVETQRPYAMQINHSLETTGQVQENQSILIATVAGQTIQSVNVTKGQRVEKGEVLFSVDTSQVESQIRELETSIEKAAVQAEKTKEQKALTLSRTQDDYDTAVNEGDRSVANAYNTYSSAVDAYNTYVTTHTEIAPDTTYDDSEADAMTDTSKYYSEEQATTLMNAVTTASLAYGDAIAAADAAVTTANRAMEDANIAMDSPSEDSTESATERQTDQKKLDELKALQAAGGKITAREGAVVTKVSVAIGEEATDGTAVMMADESAGSKIIVQVPKNYQNYMAAGNTVTVSGTDTYGNNTTVEDVEITAISAAGSDSTSGENTEGDMLDITIQIPSGALTIGSSATVKMDNKSEKYSLCIPTAALHQDDKKQYFVLIPQESESALGTELTAQKIAVTVLDKNASYAAIEEGIITEYQEIIIKSSKDIEDGSRVKR